MMITRTLVLSLLLVQAPALSARADDTQSLDAAHGLLSRGHHELAEAEYRAFLEAHSDDALASVARYGLGVCLFRQTEYAEAIETLDAIGANRFAYAAEVGTMLGRAHLALGHHEDATRHLRHVVDRYGDHELADDAGAMIVEALYAAGDRSKALAEAEAFASRWTESPLLPRTEEIAARCEMDLGRDQLAARRLARLSRTGGETPLLLAQAWHRAGDWKRAEAAYVKALSAADGPDASAGLGRLLHETGQFDKASPRLLAHIERHPKHATTPAARILLGRCILDRGKADEAVAYFTRLAEQTDIPRDDVDYWRARSVLATGDAVTAARRFGAAITKHTRSPLLAEMRHDHAVALLRQGKPEDAMATLTPIERTIDAKHHLGLAIPFLMAQAEHQAGQYEQSATRCRALLARDLGALQPAAQFLLVENTYLGGDLAAAGRGYASFIEKHPNAPERPLAELRLGLVLADLGEVEAATPWLERSATRQDATFAVARRTLGDLALTAEAWPQAREHYLAYLETEPGEADARDTRFRLAVATQRAGDHDAAQVLFDEILTKDPKHPEIAQVSYELGVLARAAKDDDAAVTHFERVIRRHGETPHAARAAFALALIASDRGDQDASARYFADAAERAATGGEASVAAEAAFQQGQMQFASEDYPDAAAAFALVIERWPSSPRIVEAIARHAIALARANDEDAATHLRQAERQDGLDPSLHAAVTYELAWTLRETGQLDDARRAYERLIEQHGNGPRADHARLELADLALANKDYAAATAWLRPLLERTDRPAVHQGALYRLGVCAYEQGEHSAAASHLEAYVDEVGTGELVAAARLLAGEALFALGAHQRVIEVLEPLSLSADEVDDDTLDAAFIRLGESYGALQLWSKSEAAYGNHLKRFADSSRGYQAHFGRGWARENQGRTTDATTDYEAVIASHEGPTAARSQFQIGECLFAADKPAEAVRAFLKVDILYAYPEWSAAALYEAGRCFEAMGDRAEARRHFEQVQTQHGKTSWSELAATRLRGLGETDLPGRSEKEE